MDAFWEYIVANMKAFENDTRPNYEDPGDPPGLGTALTQDEIDFIKKLKKEVDERFTIH